MTDDDLGTLDADGPTLSFERVYHHSIDKVWRAVTEPEHQAVWFPQQILGEPRPGAALRFVISVEPEDGFDGEMLAYDPPRLMEMRWGASRLRIELHAEGDDTRLVLAETLPDVGGAARNGAGWHECLDRLTAVIDDTVPLRWGRRCMKCIPRASRRSAARRRPWKRRRAGMNTSQTIPTLLGSPITSTPTRPVQKEI